MLTNEQREEIKNKLISKAPNLTCPMCKNQAFTMADGYFINTMHEDLKALALGGKAIPTIGLICNNCGFVSQHALGRLGLLPKETKTNNDEPK